MNLWLRLLWCLFAALNGRGLDPRNEVSRLMFRVWPHDLDPSMHMNNGRYLTLMDLGRLDVMARSGLLKAAWRHRWTPIASGIQIRYRREMRLFQRFRLETRIVCWQSHLVVMEQRFVIESGPYTGQVAAQAQFKGGLYDRGERRFVDVARLMAEVGITAESPPVPPEAAAFLAADEALRQSQGPAQGPSGGEAQ
jgi:acyl-CoA thioesterase FadM